MRRRDFLAALPAITLVGLGRKAPPPISGGFVDDGGALGHRLRDGALAAGTTRETRRVPIVIIGGGIAGLSAAWELERRGARDFIVLEMERTAGGNARSGRNDISAYPWAAHYVPIPDVKATLVRELFEELGVLRNGEWEERHLCFSPQERLFLHGEWHAGIEPEYALDAAGRADFTRFDALVAGFRESGEFTIPVARGVRRESSLDTMTMGEWLRRERLTSPALRWYVDYACRDDYGALAEQTSAWAGIHYFASRAHEEQGPLTWAEGNGWITQRLTAKLGAFIRTSEPVVRVERDRRWRVMTPNAVYDADAVIFAAPTFLAPYLIPDMVSRKPAFTYSPWLTANLTLERWPAERGRGAPPSWDNVLYDSPALGYVIATHQSLRTREERTVWTYYWALADMTPVAGRELLVRRSWKEWVELILADLERAHPDIRSCVSRIDIMRMGHAMIRPTPGFLSAPERQEGFGLPRLYFANSDVSGLSLFEEAQYRGVEAARRAMRSLSW
jgi:glycine/D-amino acid oxidase-like deaminating enzyme